MVLAYLGYYISTTKWFEVKLLLKLVTEKVVIPVSRKCKYKSLIGCRKTAADE